MSHVGWCLHCHQTGQLVHNCRTANSRNGDVLLEWVSTGRFAKAKRAKEICVRGEVYMCNSRKRH